MEKLIAGKMPFVFADHALVPLLDAAIKSMQSYAGPLAVTLVRQGDDPATVRVDAIRFEQVITNLLSNACKFSPKKSDVIIMHRLDGNEVEISVIDSGSGIPAAFRDRLFQKFSQADSTSIRIKGGTGLGLVICKQLLQRMGGMIGFESNQTRGTRFWVRLPLQ
jgi:signal transduction histidine kinase